MDDDDAAIDGDGDDSVVDDEDDECNPGGNSLL